MKTQQTGSENKPDNTDDILALIIKCPKCRTQRAFKVSDSFALVATRQSSGMEINAWCEKCSRRIAVQLCWTKRFLPGWTVQKVRFGKAVTVEDYSGLSPEKGERII